MASVLLLGLRIGVLQDSLSFQPSAGLLEGPCLDAVHCQHGTEGQSHIKHMVSGWLLPCVRQRNRQLCRLREHRHVPGIRLECICHSRHRKAAVKPPVPDTFPTLLLVFLSGLDAKQPPRRGIVARAVTTLRGLGLRELSAEGKRELEVRLAGRDGSRGAHSAADGGERRHWVERFGRRYTVSGELAVAGRWTRRRRALGEVRLSKATGLL